jgi:hypothetical protein
VHCNVQVTPQTGAGRGGGYLVPASCLGASQKLLDITNEDLSFFYRFSVGEGTIEYMKLRLSEQRQCFR